MGELYAGIDGCRNLRNHYLSLPNARPVQVQRDLVQADVGATKWVAFPHFARGVSGCLNSAFLGLF